LKAEKKMEKVAKQRRKQFSQMIKLI